MQTRALIAVVIPAYKTERSIRGVIASLPDFVTRVIVIDDRSPDRTAEIVEEKRAEDPRIHLHRHETNQGVGGAVLSGYRIAMEFGAEIVVKVDGDGQMDPAQIARLVDPILKGRADYTKGNRFLHAKQLVSMPLVRRIGNLGLSFLTKAASGYWQIFDPTNGFTAIHTTIIKEMNTDRLSRRYFFESSMLLELGLVRAVVCDVPMPARYGAEESSLSVTKALFEFPGQLLRGFISRVWIQHFIRDFSAVALLLVMGMPLLLFGTAWGAYHWLLSWQTSTTASTGTVMLSVLPFIVGFQCLLQCLVLDLQARPRKVLHRALLAEQALQATFEKKTPGDSLVRERGRKAA